MKFLLELLIAGLGSAIIMTVIAVNIWYWRLPKRERRIEPEDMW